MKQAIAPFKGGFLQAAGVSIYIFLVGLFISNANRVFPHINNFLAPILFLLLFSTSALICGLIVFYKPYKLFLAGHKKAALDTVISTALSLFVFLVLFLATLFFVKL